MKVWVECTCDYEGYAEMVKYEGSDVSIPTCPECGEIIDDITELDVKEFKIKTKGKQQLK